MRSYATDGPPPKKPKRGRGGAYIPGIKDSRGRIVCGRVPLYSGPTRIGVTDMNKNFHPPVTISHLNDETSPGD